MTPPERSTGKLFRALVLFVTLVAPTATSARAHAATIHSTLAGGPWASGSTWVGGAAPAPADEVILDGPVTVQGTTSCARLEVATAGALRSGSPAPTTLVVAGAIANAGTIEDGGPTLRLRVGGDLNNDGVWTNVETTLIGSADHHLTQSAFAIFESHLKRDVAASGDLFVDTPFAILGNLDQDGGAVVLAPGCPLTLRAGALSGEVLAQGNEIRFESWSYLDGGTYDAAVLSGRATTTGGVFTGGLTVLDTLCNVRSFGNAHIVVQGGLVNHGFIHNDHYGFTIDLAGDLECNGMMVNSFVTLDGVLPHHLRMDSNGDLRTDVMLPEFGSGTIVVESDARISDGVALGQGGTMILEPGVLLHLSGGSISGGTLVAQGNTIFMEGNGYLWIQEVDDLVLSGTARTAGTMSVAGNLRVAGALQNWPSMASEIIVAGDFVNAGAIRDTAQTLTLRIRGDALNGGSWENQRVVIDGASDQIVEIGDGIAVPEFVLAAGFAASGYQWTRDGAPVVGETGPELEFASVGGEDAGEYRCEGGEGQLSRAIVLGVGVATGTPEPGPAAAAVVTLSPVRPNPVRASGAAAAMIEFALPNPGELSLAIFDVSGRVVARPVSGSLPAGSHRVSWAVNGAAPGVYLVRLQSSGAVATRKLIVVE